MKNQRVKRKSLKRTASPRRSVPRTPMSHSDLQITSPDPSLIRIRTGPHGPRRCTPRSPHERSRPVGSPVALEGRLFNTAITPWSQVNPRRWTLVWGPSRDNGSRRYPKSHPAGWPSIAGLWVRQLQDKSVQKYNKINYRPHFPSVISQPSFERPHIRLHT